MKIFRNVFCGCAFGALLSSNWRVFAASCVVAWMVDKWAKEDM